MIEKTAHGSRRIDALGVADEIDAECRELLKDGHQDAHGASKPVIFPNQIAIEIPAACIFHQFPIGVVVVL